MWRRTEELKPASPGATAAEPAATTANSNSPAAPAVATPAEITTTPVPAVPAPPAITAASAPEKAATINEVSTIGPGLKIRGDITGSCHLIIEGEASGKIHLANGRVTVGATGRVNADIEAPEISVEGNVQGNLQARDNLRLGSASNVQGSVLTPRIRIEDGARLRGKVEMTRPGQAADSAGGKTSTATPATATSLVKTEIPKAAIVGAPRS
ncbi:MAG: polymer-forming cytoskeletal protein [Candidatus Acidiferrales bacterium]|jgi:cytoskeletal protein CcmA (bactofilin family)